MYIGFFLFKNYAAPVAHNLPTSIESQTENFDVLKESLTQQPNLSQG